MFAFEAASAYECLQIMDYSLLDAKKFRNARHKCAPKPWTGSKSRKKKTYCSHIVQAEFPNNNKKKMFTNLGITSNFSQKDLEMRATNAR